MSQHQDQTSQLAQSKQALQHLERQLEEKEKGTAGATVDYAKLQELLNGWETSSHSGKDSYRETIENFPSLAK